MSSDLRLIPHTAETDAHILFIQRPGNTLGDGGLSGSRRPHQTDNGAVSALLSSRQAAHRQKLQYALLHLLQPVMILVQDPLRAGKIRVVLGRLIPRQLQQGLNISPLHRTLGAAAGKPFEPGDFLLDPLLHFLIGLQLLHTLGKLIRLGEGIAVPQLLTDGGKLLPQKIILLILAHPSLQLFRQLLAYLSDLDLAVKHTGEQLIPLLYGHRTEHLLPAAHRKGQAACQHIRHNSQIRHISDLFFQQLPALGIQQAVLRKQIPQLSHHALLLHLRKLVLVRTHHLHGAQQILLAGIVQLHEPSPVGSLHQNAHDSTRQTAHLL